MRTNIGAPRLAVRVGRSSPAHRCSTPPMTTGERRPSRFEGVRVLMVRQLVLAFAVVCGACAQLQHEPAAQSIGTEGTLEPCSTEVRTTADLHCLVPRESGVLLVLDGQVAMLDSTNASRIRRDSLLMPLTHRVITRIEMFAPGDTAALRMFGTRAIHGVIVVDSRPSGTSPGAPPASSTAPGSARTGSSTSTTAGAGASARPARTAAP
jgi:hypothetical protein